MSLINNRQYTDSPSIKTITPSPAMNQDYNLPSNSWLPLKSWSEMSNVKPGGATTTATSAIKAAGMQHTALTELLPREAGSAMALNKPEAIALERVGIYAQNVTKPSMVCAHVANKELQGHMLLLHDKSDTSISFQDQKDSQWYRQFSASFSDYQTAQPSKSSSASPQRYWCTCCETPSSRKPNKICRGNSVPTLPYYPEITFSLPGEIPLPEYPMTMSYLADLVAESSLSAQPLFKDNNQSLVPKSLLHSNEECESSSSAALEEKETAVSIDNLDRESVCGDFDKVSEQRLGLQSWAWGKTGATTIKDRISYGQSHEDASVRQAHGDEVVTPTVNTPQPLDDICDSQIYDSPKISQKAPTTMSPSRSPGSSTTTSIREPVRRSIDLDDSACDDTDGGESLEASKSHYSDEESSQGSKPDTSCVSKRDASQVSEPDTKPKIEILFEQSMGAAQRYFFPGLHQEVSDRVNAFINGTNTWGCDFAFESMDNLLDMADKITAGTLDDDEVLNGTQKPSTRYTLPLDVPVSDDVPEPVTKGAKMKRRFVNDPRASRYSHISEEYVFAEGEYETLCNFLFNKSICPDDDFERIVTRYLRCRRKGRRNGREYSSDENDLLVQVSELSQMLTRYDHIAVKLSLLGAIDYLFDAAETMMDESIQSTSQEQ